MWHISSLSGWVWGSFFGGATLPEAIICLKPGRDPTTTRVEHQSARKRSILCGAGSLYMSVYEDSQTSQRLHGRRYTHTHPNRFTRTYVGEVFSYSPAVSSLKTSGRGTHFCSGASCPSRQNFAACPELPASQTLQTALGSLKT